MMSHMFFANAQNRLRHSAVSELFCEMQNANTSKEEMQEERRHRSRIRRTLAPIYYKLEGSD